MKKILGVLAIILFSLVTITQAFCGEKEELFSIYSLPTYSLSSSLIITCGEGYVKISLETGIAEFHNCSLDQATQALWEGLKLYFDANYLSRILKLERRIYELEDSRIFKMGGNCKGSNCFDCPNGFNCTSGIPPICGCR